LTVRAYLNTQKYGLFCSLVQVDQSIFASYGTHAMNYFGSLEIFIRQGRRMQRIQNHSIFYLFLTSGLMKHDVTTARVPCCWLEMSLCLTVCTIVSVVYYYSNLQTRKNNKCTQLYKSY